MSYAKIVFGFIDSFSKFSRQLPYVSKCEISGMGGVLKNVNVALCGMKNVDLTKEAIKVLGVYMI